MGNRRFSTVDEITLPMLSDDGFLRGDGEAFGPAQPTWIYKDPPEFYSRNISGAQRLPNGNTLICEGASGRLFEITRDGLIVWEYINPIVGGLVVEQGTVLNSNQPRNGVFRALRYPRDFGAFAGRDLTPGPTIEGE